jgi:transcription antitermination protein NusB
MATPREVRRLSFQALFQLDARGDDDLDAVRSSLESAGDFEKREIEKALRTAYEAFQNRAAADAAMLELAPGWPAHRQAAVDRAILRLAHYEMTLGGISPKVAVNEAVELAKEFSTDKSPSFVNALLDKILKKVLAGRVDPSAGAAVSHADSDPGEPPSESAPGPRPADGSIAE